MKKKGKTAATATTGRKKGNRVVSHRKNTNASTRGESRQRSGNNGPQQGSH
jgi:hypothetical protein